MKHQIQTYCDCCSTCIKNKVGNHAPFASPRVTLAPAMPFAHISMDVMFMPPTINGYDGILVVVCHFTKYTVLIPVKGKGLVDASTRQITGYTGKAAAWTAEILAYKLTYAGYFGFPAGVGD